MEVMDWYQYMCIGFSIVYLNMCIAKTCDESTEFRCYSNEKCIDASLRCNQVFDCDDQSDELNCGEICCK